MTQVDLAGLIFRAIFVAIFVVVWSLALPDYALTPWQGVLAFLILNATIYLLIWAKRG